MSNDQPSRMTRKQFLYGSLASVGAGTWLGSSTWASPARADSVSQPASGSLNVCDYGARPGVDSTQAIQRCLDDARDGMHIYFPSHPGQEPVYQTSRTLYLKDRKNVAITAAPGVRIELLEQDSSFLQAENCPGLQLDQLHCFGQYEPSTNHRNNKIIIAIDSPRIRVQRCTALGLVLGIFYQCDQCVVLDNYVDTQHDAAQYPAGGSLVPTHPRASGIFYGVQFRGCTNVRVIGNTIMNCSVDGIKYMNHLPGGDADRVYGSQLVITNNLISGCVNDDGIDVFNSGEKFIIANNIFRDNQKAMNLKRDNVPNAPAHEAIVANNLIVGGRWNQTANTLQHGINANVRDLILHGNQIRDIEGFAINFGSNAGPTIISHCLIDNIRKSEQLPRETGTGIVDGLSGSKIKARPGYGQEYLSRVDGQIIISHCIIRNCQRHGIRLVGASRGVVQGCVIEDAADCGLLVDFHPVVDYSPGDTPVSISNCRVVTRGEQAATAYGFRFTRRVLAKVLISGCVAHGRISSLFADETPDRLVEDKGNSWNQTAGSTSQRPDVQPRVGTCFYDTDLGHPIWWNGSQWVDAAGQNV